MENIDGLVAPVALANKDTCVQFARKAAGLFQEHGATRVVECWGDDVPPGKLTSFPLAVQGGARYRHGRVHERSAHGRHGRHAFRWKTPDFWWVPDGGGRMNTAIQPCLWFDHQAEEAARFYVSVFPNSCMGLITQYGPDMPSPEGTVLTVSGN